MKGLFVLTLLSMILGSAIPACFADPIENSHHTFQMLSTHPEPVPLNGNGVIKGTVTRASDGAPVRKAMIGVTNAGGQFVTIVYSDPNGHYQCRNLEEGIYKLSCNGIAEDSELPGTALFKSQFYDQKSTMQSATPVIVGEEEVTGIDFVLERGAGVWGRATRSWDGQPIPKLWVFVLDSAGHWIVNRKAATDENGEFYIAGMEEGKRYYVHSPGELELFPYEMSPGYDEVYYPRAETLEQATAMRLDSVHTDIDLVLDGVLVSGRAVRQSDGAPVVSLEIRAFTPNGYNTGRRTRTQSDGTFLLGGLVPGRYIIGTEGARWESMQKPYLAQYYDQADRIEEAEIIDLDVGIESGIDFSVRSGCSLKGTVFRKDNNEKIWGAVLELIGEDGSQHAVLSTNMFGAYKFSGLNPGRYWVRATGMVVPHEITAIDSMLYKSVYYPDAATREEATPIEVNGSVEGINLYLETGFEMSGRITKEGDGQPVGETGVELYTDTWERLGYITTNNQGQWVYGGLRAGTYYAMADGFACIGNEGCNQRYPVEYYLEADSRDEATPIEVQGDVSGIDFTLSEGRILSGIVRDAETGDPITDTYLELYSLDWQYIESYRTGFDGRYKIRGLDPTSYYLVATGLVHIVGGQEQRYLQTWYDNVWSRETASPIDMSEGDREDIDFDLATGWSICGQVYDPDGSPVVGLGIELQSNTEERVIHERSDSTGAFCFQALMPDAYRLFTTGYTWVGEEPRNVYPYQFYGQSDSSEYAVLELGQEDILDIDWTLMEALTISGTVTDTEGQPITEMLVQLLTAQHEFIKDCWVQADGSYRLELPGPGEYVVCATGWVETGNGPQPRYAMEYYDNVTSREDATVLTVQDTPLTGIDFQLQPLIAVEGTVTDRLSGQPVARVHMRALTPQDVEITATQTDSRGHYCLRVPAGEVVIHTVGWVETPEGPEPRYQQQYYDDAETLQEAHILTVTTDPFGGIDFALVPFLAIQGRITDAATGQPIARAHVRALTPQDEERQRTLSDSQGDYSLWLVPGEYVVHATGEVETEAGPKGQYGAEYYEDAETLQEATRIELADSIVTGIDLTLNTGLSISGTVYDDASGETLAGAKVELQDVTSDHFLGQQNSDKDGGFVFVGLNPGTYHVWCPGRVWRDNGEMPLYRDAFCEVTLTADESRHVTLRLQKADVLMGRLIRLDSGTGVPDARVRLYSPEWVMSSEEWSQQEGRFAIRAPEAGDFYLKLTGQIWDHATGGWNQLYHPLFYPGVYDSTRAETIHIENQVTDVVLMLKDINVSVESDRSGLPDRFELVANYPNPFNPSTRIDFTVAAPEPVTLKILNARGQCVREWWLSPAQPGLVHVDWDGCNRNGTPVGAGVYWAVLYAKDTVSLLPMTLLH